MKGQSWYPAAALSAVLMSCGGSTDESQGGPAASGGGTGIDAGVPSATGAQPSNYYGVRTSGGTSGAISTGTSGMGGIDVGHSATGGVGTGGFPGLGGYITIYGPRFDKPDSSVVSTGGSHALPSRY